jgi:hypothetical protein
MKAPPGTAKFDSSTAMAMAVARYLHGRDFSGLGQPAWLQRVARTADYVPRLLRERIFAHLGAQEGVAPRNIERVRTAEVAQWIRSMYPQRSYPAAMIGSSNGALTHIAAALGIPWLPQTFLTLVRQKHVHPDDAQHAMQAERQTGARFVEVNPDSQLHHMHDPSQDRLMLQLITYYQSKFRVLPDAYRDFLSGTLAPGATLIVVECERRWPTTRIGERYVYQFGAEGGPSTEEYFQGGPRVADYLERHDSPRRRWDPPPTDGESPEAEWGFEPALREDLYALARERNYRVVRLVFEDPEDPSALVADFHREWNARRGVRANRLVVESFVLLEPHWALRTGSVPYWMTFNMQPSLDRLHRYLDRVEPYDQIFLMLFAHGVNSVGLPPIEEWQKLLGRARVQGEFLGLHPDTYPAHFAHYGRYSQVLRSKIPSRYPLPAPLPLGQVLGYIEQHGARHGVRLECD